VPSCAHVRSFVEDAVRWHRTGSEKSLQRLIRSPFSGVSHDVGAAYATLARRAGLLLDAIDRGQLALPPDDRESVIRFARRARRVRVVPPESSFEALESAIGSAFELGASPHCALETIGEPNARDAPIELTQAPDPEERSSVPPWQRHFSASALNAYSECARKWFFKYVCGAVEDVGSAAAAYGSAFHLALEDFHGDFPRPSSGDEAAMRRRIRECVQWAFERNRAGFDTVVEFELQVRRAQRTAQRYVDWVLAEAKRSPFEVLGREVVAEIDFEGRPFVGYIDRLDRDERSGEVAVVDYKTGSIAASAAEYREKVRRFEDFQLPFYYWARTAAGDRVRKLVLVPLRDALVDVRPIVLRVGTNIEIDELERSRARMIALSDELATGQIQHFATAKDPEPCTFCAYSNACPQKPAPETARFGS
jgi:RecB family exonuclease